MGISTFLHAGASDRETLCELCGDCFPHPVTYHMRQVHPGCGHHAGSKGYNSGGNYCLGWAGNCGEGGVRTLLCLSSISFDTSIIFQRAVPGTCCAKVVEKSMLKTTEVVSKMERGIKLLEEKRIFTLKA